ncbi:MAG: hypothetical protein EOP83_14835 [Verrucomicrobiaceae bacterium]|nr:MAG: hypothetical protein EOP83_14835 [Verrucomicrobiaceae bacterium]
MTLPTPKRAKVASQFYQFSYGERGWISVYRPGAHPEQKWVFVVREYNGWDRDKGHFLRQEESGYKTLKEAREAGEYWLMTQDEKEVINKAEREETARVTRLLEERIARNDAIFADLRARGLIR